MLFSLTPPYLVIVTSMAFSFLAFLPQASQLRTQRHLQPSMLYMHKGFLWASLLLDLLATRAPLRCTLTRMLQGLLKFKKGLPAVLPTACIMLMFRCMIAVTAICPQQLITLHPWPLCRVIFMRLPRLCLHVHWSTLLPRLTEMGALECACNEGTTA